MSVHGDNVADKAGARVAFDVASRQRYPGAAQQKDVRSSAEIEVPELPWPLRFFFLGIQEDDGTFRWGCLGYEVGEPLPRDELELLDPADLELTAERQGLIATNFHRYRQLAENLLIPTPENVESAVKIRADMGEREVRLLDRSFLARFIAEWRSRRGEPDLIYNMAWERHCSRTTLFRWFRRAEDFGLIGPDERPRRKQPQNAT
jgi:hypothetical protein